MSTTLLPPTKSRHDELRQLRIDSGLSLREVARRARISAPYLCDIERGYRNLSTEREQELRHIIEKP